MLNGLCVRAFGRELARKGLAGAALFGVGLASSYAFAETRSEPYPAWPEPVIQEKMSVDEAKAIVELTMVEVTMTMHGHSALTTTAAATTSHSGRADAHHCNSN